MLEVAGNRTSSKHSEIDKEVCKPALTVESTPSTLRGIDAEDRCHVTSAVRLEVIKNYPNINDDVEVVRNKVIIDPTEDSRITTHWQGWGSRSRLRRMTRSDSDEREIFPPLLSTLDTNGLQRYELVRSVEDGRLKIQIIPNQRPELVAKVDSESGRLRLKLIRRQSQVVDDEQKGSNPI